MRRPSFDDPIPDEEQRSLVRRTLAAGTHAPQVLLDAAVTGNGAWAAAYAERLRAEAGPRTSTEVLVAKVIRRHAHYSRGEGAAVAIALSAAEAGSIVGSAGTLTPGAIATGFVADLAGMVWIQVRMALVIAALRGHDPRDPARYREIASLLGILDAASATAGSPGAGPEKAAMRLLLRQLKGERLQAVRSLARAFRGGSTRTRILKAIPGVNVPVSAVANGHASAVLGRKVDVFYRERRPTAGAR